MATILFADDESRYVEPYGFPFLEEGHTIRYARNVADAQACLEREQVSLVVLDIMMPFESVRSLLKKGVQAVVEAPERELSAGIELYRWIRENHPKVSVVILSVLSEDAIRQRAQQAGPPVHLDCPILQKGQDFDHALQVLRQAVSAVSQSPG
jgi:CheY-like chemotaxis protein